MTLLCTAGFVVLVPRLAAAVPARHPAFGGDHGLDGPGEVHGPGFRRGVGHLLGGRSAAAIAAGESPCDGRPRPARCSWRRPCPGTSTCIWARESFLSLLEPLVSVALLGRWLHASAGLRDAFQAGPGIADVASFPWTATYRTTAYVFVEGYDGILGFWAWRWRRVGSWRRGAGGRKGDSPHLRGTRSEGVLRTKGDCPLLPATGTWRLSASR